MNLLRGIFPVLFTPFDTNGQIDADSLRRVVRFELEGGVNGLGVNGFASEAYKLSDAERLHNVEIVAAEVAGSAPLIVGMAPGSLETAIELANLYAPFNPAALMTLPPSVMNYDESALVDFYVALGDASPAPIMVQQSPHYPGYSAGGLSVDSLAEIAARCANVRYFKIEGPGSPARVAELYQRVDHAQVTLFGGVGGIALQDELRAGAAGLLPGVGFNEFFVRVWAHWEQGETDIANSILQTAQPLVEAVSGHGHEHSLHARKYLMQRAGIITHATVRRPMAKLNTDALEALGKLVDTLGLRISRGNL
ncbi:MAG: dihydrodipicolinate synthase family protein [Burkholderiales bacterium]|nr:dihydrodipicolinate synthase family protein [Anaerolineae bacterium]